MPRFDAAAFASHAFTLMLDAARFFAISLLSD